MVTRFYKGVGPGTYLYARDLRATGILPRQPHMPHDIVAVEQHIAYGTTTSPYVSLTRSYGVAQNYATNAYLAAPAPASPGYVYELRIPDRTSWHSSRPPFSFLSVSGQRRDRHGPLREPARRSRLLRFRPLPSR